MADFQHIITKLHAFYQSEQDPGLVADYIPELGNVNPDLFGVHLTTLEQDHFCAGDSDIAFSIQSIAKVLSLTLAFELADTGLWKRVGVEPSGTPFNSFLLLEQDAGIPRNPLINAGALVICDVLISHLKNPKADFLDFVRKLSDNPGINYNPKISASEKSAGYRNAALVNLMKSYGNIENDTYTVLDFYFDLCSLEMSCREVSETFLFLAGYGKNPFTGRQIISSSKSKRINAIMQLCGMYDEAGEFSFRTGLPGKSGVGGGIVAVHPGQYCITVWSPRLNKKGNSWKGMKFLEQFTTETELSIF